MRTFFQAAAVLVALLVTAGVADVSASPYRLETLAQVGDVIDGRTIVHFSPEYTNVAINNEGEVAFFAVADGPDGIGYSVLTQRRFIAGAGKVVDGTVPRFNSEDHQVDINSSGQVVYTAFLPQGGRGLFVNEDLLFQPGDTIDGRTITLIFRFPQINDFGTVVVEGRYAGPDEPVAIFSQHGILARSGQVIDGYTIGNLVFPRIGDNGDIAYFGFLNELNYSTVVTPNRVALNVGDMVDDIVVGRVDGLGGISDAGEIVMSIKGGEFPEWQEYVVTEERVLLRPGDIIGGMTIDRLATEHVVLNDNDQLAVLGTVMNTDGTFHDTLFAAGNLVTSEGDMVNGKTVAEIFPGFDMNDLGTVAFRVQFDDGSRAVLLATVPEPSTHILILASVAAAFIAWRSRRPRMRRHR
jgi:hypothetical protein